MFYVDNKYSTIRHRASSRQIAIQIGTVRIVHSDYNPLGNEMDAHRDVRILQHIT